MSAPATPLEALSPARRALFEKLRAGARRPNAALADGPRPRGAHADPLPLSFAQERLWMLEQLEPGRPAYNVPAAVRLQGALDAELLRRALDHVVRRHEALRTTFPLAEGRPWQRVSTAAAFDFAGDDLAGQPDPESGARALAQADARRPFNLVTGPLLRARLVRLREDEHVLALTLHHVVSDGWSLGVLVRELIACYVALRSGADPALPPPALHYPDYAVWQRETLQGARLDVQLAYWKRALHGAPHTLDLPADRPRPERPTGAGATLTRALGSTLTEAVNGFARRHGATPFMVLLAAYHALVARHAGRDDVLVGTPVAGRTHPELEGLVGCFVNTLVLRGDLRGAPSFAELAARVRQATLEAHAHQELPFERLVSELRVARDPARTPLVQVFFALHNEPAAEPRLPGLRVRPFEVDAGAAKFDLSLSLVPGGAGLVARAEYATDLFDAATAERLLERYAALLAAGLREPQRRVTELPLLGEHERRQVLTDWNATRVDYGPDGGLHRWIEAQAARTPAAEAVRFDGTALDYRELNARANRLARELRARGVGAETRVGVCLERSLELVVALLAVLKAGGAYVPLDPSYPAARLAGMLEDARPALVVTQPQLVPRLPASDVPLFTLPAGWRGAPESGAHDLPGETAGAQLAYVIFTSGSTGRPKGAMNTHAGVCNRLLWMQAQYGLGPGDRVLQKTPFSFDVSVWEFFWPLMAGATLVLAAPGGHRDGAYLVRTLRDERITTLHFVPSMLALFLEEPGLEDCTSLKRVICSGEALPCDLQERFFARLPCELHNLYGPTEAAVDVSFWACRRGDARRVVPIGAPVANTRLYVLDHELQPAPVGVTGELYIGGVQVGRGYLNRPELTAERFVPDPFAAEPGARLYRTGDLARWLPDGTVDFLGRADQQVKIRGQRIEPGEIEAALRAHPDVRDAALVARADARGDLALAAYVVAAGEPRPEEWRAFLAQRLPEGWLPAAFVTLDALPLTPSGKLDRAALPAPAAPCAAERPACAAPRTPRERRVAQAFAEALGIDAVGLDDDFFALGGDSFKAIRAVRRLEGALPVVELLRHPTVRRLAERLGAGSAEAPGRLTHLRAARTADQVTVVAVPYGGGDALGYAALARALPAQWGVCVAGLPGRGAPQGESIAALARAAAGELERDVPGPLVVYGHCVGVAPALELARRLEERGRTPRAVLLAAALPPRRFLHRVETALVKARNRVSSDAALARRLRGLGGFDGGLEGADAARLLRHFRDDVAAALDWFGAAYAGGPRPLHAPVTLLFGDADPFTRGFVRRAAAWGFFAARPTHAVLPGGGHYFLKHQAAALAELIVGRLAHAERASRDLLSAHE